MISFKVKGNFDKTETFLERAKSVFNRGILDKYAQRGVVLLSNATPVDSGETAKSWSYRIIKTKDSTTIEWINSNTKDGVNIAILLQYDHMTGTGGFVKGIDYINPAMRPLFDEISEGVRKEVT